MKRTRPNFALLAELHAIVDGIPDKRIRMDRTLALWGPARSIGPISAHNCATVGCALGWASLHPTFQALGLVFNGTEFTMNGLNLSYDELGTRLFGITRDDAYFLFRPASIYHKVVKSHSDKEIFKHRVREFFMRHGQPVRERSTA